MGKQFLKKLIHFITKLCTERDLCTCLNIAHCEHETELSPLSIFSLKNFIEHLLLDHFGSGMTMRDLVPAL